MCAAKFLPPRIHDRPSGICSTLLLIDINTIPYDFLFLGGQSTGLGFFNLCAPTSLTLAGMRC